MEIKKKSNFKCMTKSEHLEVHQGMNKLATQTSQARLYGIENLYLVFIKATTDDLRRVNEERRETSDCKRN